MKRKCMACGFACEHYKTNETLCGKVDGIFVAALKYVCGFCGSVTVDIDELHERANKMKKIVEGEK